MNTNLRYSDALETFSVGIYSIINFTFLNILNYDVKDVGG
jgi:hypothetical protein